MMNDDMALVREYATSQSEPAFETLVSRHVSLVHSAALRQVGDPHLAEEITQTVFTILARKAGSLSPKTILPGWLYRTTRFVSSAAMKMQHRRERREQEAHMQATTLEAQTDSVWAELSPLLDEAMAQLRDKDRDALVLCYFQNKSLRDVGAALGVDEYAAQKRVGRALEKLRRFFSKRRIVSTTTIIAGAISANSVQAASPLLVKSVAAAAIAKGAAAGGSTLTLIKGALELMAWTKAKTVVAVGAAVILSAGSITIVERMVHSSSTRQGRQILNKVVAANSFWLLAPPDTVKNYSYVFHLAWDKAPGGVVETPFHISNPTTAPAKERQGITYSSLLQLLAKSPERVRTQSIKEEDGRITLALKVFPAPGAPTTRIIAGNSVPIPPLGIECGNGISGSYRGYFSTGGTDAVLVIDAERMVPLSCLVEVPNGSLEESFSDYVQVNPGSYAPLSVTINNKNSAFPPEIGNIVFYWKFKLHDGLWLFDESRYRGQKVAWTDQVLVN